MNADLRAKMNIASDYAVEFLSVKHGVSIATISNAIELKNERILKQYIQLLLCAGNMF